MTTYQIILVLCVINVVMLHIPPVSAIMRNDWSGLTGYMLCICLFFWLGLTLISLLRLYVYLGQLS